MPFGIKEALKVGESVSLPPFGFTGVSGAEREADDPLLVDRRGDRAVTKRDDQPSTYQLVPNIDRNALYELGDGRAGTLHRRDEPQEH